MGKISSYSRFVITEATYELRQKKDLRGPLRTWASKVGNVRALLFELPRERKYFVLIGKGTDLYKGSVSCQDPEFKYALHNKLTLVGGLKPKEGEMTFYVFLPEWLVEGHLEKHEKFQTVISFPFSMGEIWNLVESLSDPESRLRTRMANEEKDKKEALEFKERAEKISSYFQGGEKN